MPLFGSKASSKTATRPFAGSAKKPGLEPRILRLAWLGLKAVDIVEESTFIERTLRLQFLDEGNSTTGHHVRYNCGSIELELVTGGTVWATRPKPRRGQPDVPLIASFSVDNIISLSERLNESEVPRTQTFEQGWVASFLFLDPERNLWQVSESRVEPASQTEEASVIGSLWLSVEDYPAQLIFYRDTLGLPLVDEGPHVRPITLEAERFQAENPLERVILPASPNDPSVSPNLAEGAEVEAESGSLSDGNPGSGAVFFAEGVRLALSPGGKRLEGGAERVWGRDTAFLPGFQTNNLNGLVERLRAAGVRTTEPFPFARTLDTRELRSFTTRRAVRFSDPEGHVWQVFE